MPLTNETQNIQSTLARYCRTGVIPELPGVSVKGLQQYRRLVYNVIDDTLEGAFPITHAFLSAEEWHELVTFFFKEHACQTTSVWKLPYEFYEFVNANDLELKHLYPFLVDLLYFEWLEIEVHTMPDYPVRKYRLQGNWLTDQLVLNPEFRLVNLNYPVHLFTPSELNEEAKEGNYYVLTYRELDTGNVQFFDVSIFYGYMIMQIIETEKNQDNILNDACALFNLERTTELEQSVEFFLDHLLQKKFLLGYVN